MTESLYFEADSDRSLVLDTLAVKLGIRSEDSLNEALEMLLASYRQSQCGAEPIGLVADLQVDALRAAGCERIYTESVGGARAERPVLNELLRNVRPDDVLGIRKLDRLGRSLKHPVELAGMLMDQDVGLRSLHDPVDTTSPQGRLTFNIFASLAERLSTPLQIEQHLALEEAFQIGGQPVTTEVVESVLAKDINELEPKLTRHGYGHKALAEILNIGQGDVRKLLRGQLPPGRALDLQAQMLKAGLPL
jgi:DNA invertase Pin-like site-specific DNA recombinase